MSEPLIVVIPHRLGKDEALRRIKDGLGRAKTEFAWLLSLEEEVWTGDKYVALRKQLLDEQLFPVCRRCCKVELSPEPVGAPAAIPADQELATLGAR